MIFITLQIAFERRSLTVDVLLLLKQNISTNLRGIVQVSCALYWVGQRY